MKLEEGTLTRNASQPGTGGRSRAHALLRAAILSLMALSIAGCLVQGVRIRPRNLTWGSVALGSSGTPQAVTLSNIGTSQIAISSVAISGANASDFVISSKTCGATLAASSSCSVTVTFTPTAPGPSAATLTLGHSGFNSSATVPLSGTATGKISTLTVSPQSLSFGAADIGSSTASQTVTLQSDGTTTISINSVTISGPNPGDFSITSNVCGSSLAGSGSCTIGVLFKPSASGSRTAALTISDSAGGSPHTVALSGSGNVPAPLSIAPTDPTVVVNGTVQFSANAIVTWTSSCGTITNSGLFTAPSSAGSCTVTATGTNTTPPSVSTAVNVIDGSTSGTLSVYPSSAADYIGTDQAFQAQLSSAPDANPVTFSVDGVAGGNANTGFITAQGIYTAPDVAGNHTVTVQDTTLGTAASAKITVFSEINVDYDSRSTTLPAINPNLFGAERMESLHDTADIDLVMAAGIGYARIYAQIPLVFSTNSTPNWRPIDFLVQRFSAAGLKVMLQMVQTPAWLQPNPNPCGSGNTTAVPSDMNAWGSLAAQYVKHMDEAFPGVVTDYEIWNEPNTTAFCSSNRPVDYMKLYSAAAPLMRAQAATDAQSTGLPAARIGGPATSGLQPGWVNEMLADPVISQNVDFISYHDYLFNNHQTQAMWDTYNNVVSVYQRTQDSGAGPGHTYAYASRLIASGKQPQGKSLPIYNTEYNLNWQFAKNCCANDPTYSPVWNSMYAADMLNAIYNGASIPPGHMIYFAATALPYFCLVGTIDPNMDCAYPDSSSPQPYPQYYAYQLFGASNYLDLEAGGYMAKSISPGTDGNGIVVTAFYTKDLDAIVIINPNQNTLSNVPISLANTGLTSAQGALYQIVNGQSIQSSPISLQKQAGTSYTTTLNIRPYSVQAIAIR
jgi:hypothetical protein